MILEFTWFDRIQTIPDTAANREIVQRQRTPTTTYQSLHKMAIPVWFLVHDNTVTADTYCRRFCWHAMRCQSQLLSPYKNEMCKHVSMYFIIMIIQEFCIVPWTPHKLKRVWRIFFFFLWRYINFMIIVAEINMYEYIWTINYKRNKHA